MKKGLFFSLALILCIALSACSSDEKNENNVEGSNKIFTEKDIKTTEEMLTFLDEKMKEFEIEINNAVKNKEIQLGNDEEADEKVRELANALVVEPFLEKYSGSIIPEEVKGEEQIFVYFNKISSEPCSLGFCEYDGIEVMNLEYSFEDKTEYRSKNFDHSELILSDVLYDYENDEEEAGKSQIHFVKDKEGTIILTQHPYLSFETLNFKELDKEFESITTDVPESEVAAEEAEFKEEVEETLAKFPELQ